MVIPSRRYRKQPRDYDRLRYKERNIVERFINRIKWYRRIFTRYEKLARRFMAFLHFAATLIWLERKCQRALAILIILAIIATSYVLEYPNLMTKYLGLRVNPSEEWKNTLSAIVFILLPISVVVALLPDY